MSRGSLVTVLGTALVLAACVSGGQQSLRDGILRTGIGQHSVLKEWGPPDRTMSAVGEDALVARWGPGGGGVSKGRRALDLWIYTRHDVELVFDDGDLIAWKTSKTVEELKRIPATRSGQ